MKDLIERQAAIDDLHGKDPSQIWDTADVEVWLNDLPSEQPEPCDDPRADIYYLAEKIGIHRLYALVVELRGEPEPCEDTISRQQAITALRALSDDDGYINAPHEDVTDVVRGLPPVKVKQGQTTQPERGESDKLAPKMGQTWIDVTCPNCGCEIHVESEIVRCKDCKFRDEGYRRTTVKWLPCMEMMTGGNWFCGSAERREDG